MSPKESEDSVSLRPSEQRMDVLLTRLKLEEMSQKHHYHLPQLVSKKIKGPCPFFKKSSARRRRNAKAFYLTKTLCALVPLKYVILLICPLLCQLKSSSSSSVMRWHDVLSDDQFRNGAIRASTTLRFLWSKTLSFDKL